MIRHQLKVNLFLLLIPSCILILNVLFLKDASLFYMSWPDPTYSYLINGLNLASGNFEIGLTGHPGTPVQIFTALIIRIVFIFRPGDSVVDDVMNNPELYLIICSFILILINCAVCFWSAKVILEKTGSVVLALLSQFPIPLSFVSITFMRNLMTEPFLILGCQVIALLCVLVFHKPPSKKQLARYGIYFSILTGFMVATKFSSFPIMLVPLFLLPGIAGKLKYIFLSVLFFLVFTIPIWNKFGELFGFLSDITTHTEKYGTGKEGIIEWKSFIENLGKIFLSEIPFATFYLCLIVAILFSLKNLFSSGNNSFQGRIIAGIFAACTLQIIITAKHYSPHYMIPAHYYYLPGVIAGYDFFRKKVNEIEFSRVAASALLLLVALILARDIGRFQFFPGLRNPKLNTVEFIDKNYRESPRLIISSTASSFPEPAFAQARAYSGDMKSFYNEWLKRKYPHTYFYNSNDASISDWAIEYTPDEIAALHRRFIIYVFPHDFEGTVIEEILAVFSALDTSGTGISFEKVFHNFETDEVIYEIQSDSSKFSYARPLLREINCDAERVSKDKSQFVSVDGKYAFANGVSQSSEKKLSGSYSMKLTGDNVYGMEIKLNTAPGRFYEASVWRNEGSSDGLLIASAENSELFYKGNSTVYKEWKGWEQVVLKFKLPSDFPDTLLKIYIWNKGSEEIYFDDLVIKEYDR